MTSAPHEPESTVVALVVEDEPQLQSIIAFTLETEGFSTVTAGSAEAARHVLDAEKVDLIVLDIMLPGRSGLDLLRTVRARSTTPVLLLTARSEVSDRIEGFEAGADDYLTKPFHPRELALRAQAVLRRHQQDRSNQIVVGDLEIDAASMRVHLRGTVVDLSGTEFRLLYVLASRAGDVLSWWEILRDVWNDEYHTGGRELVKSTVYRLRSKLAAVEGYDDMIEAVRGVGYSLRAEPRR